MGVRLHGFDEVINFFVRYLPTLMVGEGEKKLEEWSRRLYEYTKSNHPWISRTGDLERSHYYRRVGKLHWEVGADTRREGHAKNYAVFLEYGTRHAKPYPWFGPAVEVHRKQFFEDFKEVARKVFGRRPIPTLAEYE